MIVLKKGFKLWGAIFLFFSLSFCSGGDEKLEEGVKASEKKKDSQENNNQENDQQQDNDENDQQQDNNENDQQQDNNENDQQQDNDENEQQQVNQQQNTGSQTKSKSEKPRLDPLRFSSNRVYFVKRDKTPLYRSNKGKQVKTYYDQGEPLIVEGRGEWSQLGKDGFLKSKDLSQTIVARKRLSQKWEK